MLKATVDSIDTVPEAVRDMYVEKEGKFHLQVEGFAPVAKLNEFRDNNIKLINEKKALEEKFSGVDLDAFKQMQEQQRQIKDKQLIDAGKVDELFEQRLTPMRQAHETELAAERRAKEELQVSIDKLVIDSALRDSAIKAGVMPTAVDDVLLRGRTVFRTVNGRAVAMDGDRPVYGSNGEELTAEGWVTKMQQTAPHWWPASQGSGSRGNTNGAGGTGTMTRKQFDALDPIARANAVKTTKIVD